MTAFSGDGKGRIECRLAIEGLKYEFVTDRAMAVTATDDRIRVHCLLRDGIKFGERVDPARAELEGEGFTATMIERQGDDILTTAFAYRPTVRAYLTADLTAAAMSATLTSTTGIAANDYIHIGTETIKVGAVASPTLTGLTRAQWDTIAQKHFTADGERLALPAVTNRPTTLEGRRVRLYTYDDTQSLASTSPTAGTLRFRGVCTTDAALAQDGATWSVQIGSIVDILDQQLGADLELPSRPRGIYFTVTAPFVMEISENTVATRYGGGAPVTNTVTIPSSTRNGFFESWELFCDALSADIITSGLTGMVADRLIAQATRSGFSLSYDTDTATARYLTVIVQPYTVREPASAPTESEPVDTVLSSESYYLGDFQFGFPYGHFGGVMWRSDVGDQPDNPPYRIHLDGAATLSTSLTAATIDWPSGEQSSHQVLDVNATTRFVDLALAPEALIQYGSGRAARAIGGRGGLHLEAPSDALPSVSFVRRLGSIGHLGNWRNHVTTNSANLCNNGAIPLLTTADLADWTTSITDIVAQRPITSSREYTLISGIDLKEFLSHEMRLLGVYPYVDASQAIALRALKAPVATDRPTLALDNTTILVDSGFPKWERNARFGSINTIMFRQGWNGRTQEWVGTPVVVRNVASFGTRRAARTVEIEPRSQNAGSEPSYDDVVHIASPILGLFGDDYSIAAVDVALTAIAVLLGDVITITSAVLPNTSTGARSVIARAALVIGRTFDLGSGRGQLELLMSEQDIAGYTPSVRVVSRALVSGNEWTITVATTSPADSVAFFQTSDVLTDHFTVGDEVRIYEWNIAAPTELAGSVTAINDATPSITVLFDSAWTLGSNTWIVQYDVASQAEASQQEYVYLGQDDAEIGFSTVRAARVFAP